LVKEAEKFKGEDEILRKKVEAKNGLENYTYSVRNSLNDEKLKDKFKEEEKTTVTAKVDELVKWLEQNQAGTEE